MQQPRATEMRITPARTGKTMITVRFRWPDDPEAADDVGTDGGSPDG